MNKRISAIIEIIILAGILIAGFHFVHERASARCMPQGDEGSWMSVAAELASGNGFTTRWLEQLYYTPYTVPRPTDSRYPALTLLLGIAFKTIGTSYDTALGVCCGIFLVFVLLLYLFTKQVFGKRSALLTSLVTVCSLLQLEWSSAVYCEGLFGCVLVTTVWLSVATDNNRVRHWIALGAAIGMLYLVRPNGAVLFIGCLWQIFLMRKLGRRAVAFFLYSAVSMLIVMSPWIVRTMIYFGNPFHIAGGAGLLQTTFAEDPHHTFLSFISSAGPVFILKATMIGAIRFFSALEFFEHGIYLFPLAFSLVGLFRKKTFYNAFTYAGFSVMFILCCYTTYKSSAGVRYMTAFLPLVYAYGIAQAVWCWDRVFSKMNKPIGIFTSKAGLIFLAFIFVTPVFYPHRYYERTLCLKPAPSHLYKNHISYINSAVGANGSYFALELGQLNFLTQRNCIGLFSQIDSAKMRKAYETFHPKLLALMRNEIQSQKGQEIIEACARNGYILLAKDSSDLGIYFTIASKSVSP